MLILHYKIIYIFKYPYLLHFMYERKQSLHSNLYIQFISVKSRVFQTIGKPGCHQNFYLNLGKNVPHLLLCFVSPNTEYEADGQENGVCSSLLLLLCVVWYPGLLQEEVDPEVDDRDHDKGQDELEHTREDCVPEFKELIHKLYQIYHSHRKPFKL